MKPPKDRPTSRRSSFSGSAAPSPAQSARHIGRSPSPMPPLPAIRQPQSSSASWATFKMYGDEGYTNFFRRLTFSPDGAFLLTPAGHFEDTSVVPSSSSKGSSSGKNGGGAAVDDPPSRPKKGTRASESSGGSKSSVYIYSRANFSRPPIAHLPGHQKASVAVKFSPLLYELRQGVVGGAGEEREKEVKRIGIERGKDQVVDLDLGGAVGGAKEATRSSSSTSESGSGPVAPSPSPSAATPERPIYAPAPRRPPSASPSLIGQRESDASDRRAPTPAQTPSMMMNALTPAATGSVFALPYRMLYSVATQDTIVVYDTQQAGPVCLFTNLHYASFTDMAWWVLRLLYCVTSGCADVLDCGAGRPMVNRSCSLRRMGTVRSWSLTTSFLYTTRNNITSNCNPSSTRTTRRSRRSTTENTPSLSSKG